MPRSMILQAAEKYAGRSKPSLCVALSLPKLTHLHLNSCRITAVSKDLPQCLGLRVLYLWDNRIRRLEHLEFAPNLTHLYLQNNDIETVHSLRALAGLRKLYLDGNRIQRLGPGFEGCPLLEELHVSNQRLPQGCRLELDAKAIRSLGSGSWESLHTLRAAGNGVVHPSALAPVRSLTNLDLSNNGVSDLREVMSLAEGCQNLQSLSLKGCPVCAEPKYKDNVIMAAREVVDLDGEAVKPNHRDFLISFQAKKRGKAASTRRLEGPGGNKASEKSGEHRSSRGGSQRIVTVS